MHDMNNPQHLKSCTILVLQDKADMIINVVQSN